MASLVKTRLGKAVKVLRGMSRMSEERLVKARLGKAAVVWYVEARCSMLRQIVEWRAMLRQSCLGSASRVVVWQSRQVQMRQSMDWRGGAVEARKTINKSERR